MTAHELINAVKIGTPPIGGVTLNLRAFVSAKFTINDFSNTSSKKETVILQA